MQIHELRLMGRVAQLYYGDGATQAVISRQLNISQATVSRLLRRAQQEDIVRITISAPRGTFLELESAIRTRFGMTEVIIVEPAQRSEESILSAIGAAAAHHIETTMQAGEIIGLSSWSASLLRTVDSLGTPRNSASRVIQLLGGTGNPAAEKHATHLTMRMAQITRGKPQLLVAPGLTQSPEARAVLMKEPFVRETADQFGTVTLALVGIGALEPSQLIATSGNRLTVDELEDLGKMGAVGDMGLRFFDSDGGMIRSSCDERIIGIDLAQLSALPRVVAVAGGARKVAAIRGAMLGGYITELVTDNETAILLAS